MAESSREELRWHVSGCAAIYGCAGERSSRVRLYAQAQIGHHQGAVPYEEILGLDVSMVDVLAV